MDISHGESKTRLIFGADGNGNSRQGKSIDSQYEIDQGIMHGLRKHIEAVHNCHQQQSQQSAKCSVTLVREQRMYEN